MEMELTEQSQQRFNSFRLCSQFNIIRHSNQAGFRHAFLHHAVCRREPGPNTRKTVRFRILLVWFYYFYLQCCLAVSALLDLSLAYQHSRARGTDTLQQGGTGLDIKSPLLYFSLPAMTWV